MKNTLILLLIVVLISAYFMMQDEDKMVVSQLNPISSTIEPVTPAQAPAVLSESGNSDANKVDKSARDPSAATTSKPLEPGIRDAVRQLVNTSHEGLVEEKTDNGVEMKLNGRFRTAPVATVDEQGEVTVRDYTSPPTE
jgi:hypothetical protein